MGNIKTIKLFNMLTPEEKADYKKSFQELKNTEMKMINPANDKTKKGTVTMTIHLGMEFGITLFLFLWLWEKADEYMGISPWLFFLFGLMGFFTALYRLIKSAGRLSHD